MQTLGIDLSVQRQLTGLCVLRWMDDGVEAAFPGVPDDAELPSFVAERCGESIAIDAPLGWPQDFARAIQRYMFAGTGDWHDGATDFASSYHRLRETDRWIVDNVTGFNNKPVRPLSVSADKLGATAMKAAWLLSRLRADHAMKIDRSGAEGRVIETYPAAAASAWELKFLRKYKNLESGEAKGTCQRIQKCFEELNISFKDDVSNEHEVDALVCGLVAGARLRGWTQDIPENTPAARTEGWIHVPVRGYENLKRVIAGSMREGT